MTKRLSVVLAALLLSAACGSDSEESSSEPVVTLFGRPRTGRRRASMSPVCRASVSPSAMTRTRYAPLWRFEPEEIFAISARTP